MLFRIALPALALAIAAPLAAETKSVAVSYSDLDLTRPDGRVVLEQRLNRAARQACKSGASLRNLAALVSDRACIAKARANYQPQVELALNAANARRVAMLANKMALIVSF
ncbi:UrcA family protein [Erythrobacter sp. R86502]|uniref:UrcA family protein n=1 Tax=Erythrobacter sp. R86502 TaxID=3093846 RepID=UPI0036D33CFE